MARGRVLGGLLLLCAVCALLGPSFQPSEGGRSEARAPFIDASQIFDKLVWVLFRHVLCAGGMITETLEALPKKGLLSALKAGLEARRDCLKVIS